MNALKQKLYLFFLLLSVTQIAYAQNIDISGKIVDSQNQPLQGSLVQLLNDTIKIAQGLTNDKGTFKLHLRNKSDKGNKKTLKISCLGYESQSIELENNLTDNIELGTISLSLKAQQMGEAIVSTSRTTLTNGKIIKIPSKKEKEHASDAVSLLKQMGLADLNVDLNKGIIKNSVKNVAIYINNMPATMEEAFALPTNEVVRVEYHTHPQGEFMGVDYLVNFITRSPKHGGLLMGSITQNEEVSGIYRLTYKMYHKKSQFGFSYSGFYRDDKTSYSKVSQFTNPIDNTSLSQQEIADRTINRSHRNSFGLFHYYRTDDFSSNLGLYLNLPKSPLTHSTTTRTQDNQLQKILLDESKSSQSYTPSLDWNIRKEWKNGDVLKSTLGLVYGKNKDYSLKENHFDNESTPYFSWINNTKEDYYKITNNIIYSKSLNKAGQIDFNLYNMHIWFDEKYMGSFKRNILQYDGLVYPTIGYSWSYKQKLNISLQMGAKYMVTTQTDESKIAQTFLAPSAAISYNFKKAYISFSYGNASAGAAPSHLGNVEQRMDDIQSKRGNPTLKNMRLHSLALQGYIQIPKNMLSWSIVYNPQPNSIRWTTLYDNGRYVHMPINDGTHHPLTITLGNTANITNNLQATVNLGWNYNKEVCTTCPQTISSFFAYADLRYWVGAFTFGAYCYKPCKTYEMFDMFTPTARQPFTFNVYAYYTRPHYSLSISCYNLNKRHPQIVESSTGALFSQYQKNYTSLEEKRTGFVTLKLTFNLRYGNKKFQYEDFEIKNNSNSAIMK